MNDITIGSFIPSQRNILFEGLDFHHQTWSDETKNKRSLAKLIGSIHEIEDGSKLTKNLLSIPACHKHNHQQLLYQYYRPCSIQVWIQRWICFDKLLDFWQHSIEHCEFSSLDGLWVSLAFFFEFIWYSSYESYHFKIGSHVK